MTDIEKARQLFRDAGLAFPTIPQAFAARLKERGRWHFATCEIEAPPYDLEEYIREVDGTHVEDHVVLSHSGHGANSYALQYYVVHGTLRMFLHLGWGGAYMDSQASAAKIRDCFSLADQIVSAAENVGRFRAGGHLTVVACDFYGSFWVPSGDSRRVEVMFRDRETPCKKPLKVLDEVLHWLTSPR